MTPFIAPDTLKGSAHTVRVTTAHIRRSNGKYIEGPPRLINEATYNIKGQKQDESTYSPDGTLATKRVFRYNPKGELSEVAEYNPDGSLRCKTVYASDGDGNIEEVSYGNMKASDGKTIYKYKNGRQTGVTTLNSDGAPVTDLVISYDDANRVSEVAMCVYPTGGIIAPGVGGKAVVPDEATKQQMKGIPPCVDGLLASRTKFNYRENGDLAETVIYAYDNSLISKESYDKKYDAFGNWIKVIKSVWNFKTNSFDPAEIIYRSIVYY